MLKQDVRGRGGSAQTSLTALLAALILVFIPRHGEITPKITALGEAQ